MMGLILYKTTSASTPRSDGGSKEGIDSRKQKPDHSAAALTVVTGSVDQRTVHKWVGQDKRRPVNLASPSLVPISMVSSSMADLYCPHTHTDT